jgi:hypothetical protein
MQIKKTNIVEKYEDTFRVQGVSTRFHGVRSHTTKFEKVIAVITSRNEFM